MLGTGGHKTVRTLRSLWERHPSNGGVGHNPNVGSYGERNSHVLLTTIITPLALIRVSGTVSGIGPFWDNNI